MQLKEKGQLEFITKAVILLVVASVVRISCPGPGCP